MKLKRVTACILASAMALSVALTGCGSAVKADAVGATLNGEDISLGFLNFMARYQQASIDSVYLAYFGTEMWGSDLYGDGKTMEASTKEDIVDSVETMYLLEDHMADYNVEITEEELDAMEKAARKFMSDNSKKAMKQVGATEEYVKEMLRLYTIQSKMRKAIIAEADTKVSDEEAAQRTFSYIKIGKDGDYDTDNKFVEFTDEEKKELAKKVKDIAKAAKDDFEKAAKDADYTVSTHSYGKDYDAEEDSMEEDVIKEADKLKEGGVSGLITTDKNYYIIRLDSELDKEATDKKKESLKKEKQEEHFTEICDGYKEDAKFELNEKEWEKVKFDNLFKAVTPEDEKDEGSEENESDQSATPDEGTESNEADE